LEGAFHLSYLPSNVYLGIDMEENGIRLPSTAAFLLLYIAGYQLVCILEKT
jgi:hypothetical protein